MAFSAIALAAISGASAVLLDVPRSNDDPFSTGSAGGYKKYRQAMVNYGDVQYISYIDVGHQTLTGILDTGSFELVVFSKNCYTCGNAAKYDPIQSPTHRSGHLMSGQSYGSGETWSREAFDVVSIGPYNDINQSFWEVTKAHMPVLFNSVFQCIIGVGPPETPAADAWEAAKQATRNVSEFLSLGQKVPPAVLKKADEKMQIATSMYGRTTMLDTFKANSFSVCIGKKPKSDGYFIWNDTSHEEEPSLFTEVPVIGKHTWSVSMSNARLIYEFGAGPQFVQPVTLDAHNGGQVSYADESEQEEGPGISYQDRSVPDAGKVMNGTGLGCESGCSALIDSGTSLLALPSNVINQLVTAMRSRKANCSTMSDLPSLAFDMGGTTFMLPPDVYVAEVAGSVPSYMQSFVRVRSLAGAQTNQRPGNRCELLVMESFAKTPHGPLWIFGLPFFRRYYTTFKVGATNAQRSLLFANASSTCTPTASAPPVAHRTELWKRTVDPSQLWVPLSVQKAVTADYVQL